MYVSHGPPPSGHNVESVFIGCSYHHKDADVKLRFLDAMRRVDHIHWWSICLVVAKFQTFKKHRGTFVNMPLAMEANNPPFAWWNLVGEGGTHLIPLAKSILAQVCSSLSCKRNCSYLFVHTKTRNRLSLARAENFDLHLYQWIVGVGEGTMWFVCM